MVTYQEQDCEIFFDVYLIHAASSIIYFQITLKLPSAASTYHYIHQKLPFQPPVTKRKPTMKLAFLTALASLTSFTLADEPVWTVRRYLA
jgi:hypothetical protein